MTDATEALPREAVVLPRVDLELVIAKKPVTPPAQVHEPSTVKAAATFEAPPATAVEEPTAPELPDLSTAAPLAAFLFDDPKSSVGTWLARTAGTLASYGRPVHIYSRHPFDETDGVVLHRVEVRATDDIVGEAAEFCRRATRACEQDWGSRLFEISLLGLEWSTAAALKELRPAVRRTILSLHSLERQRSDLSTPVAREIEALEVEALGDGHRILLHNDKSDEIARELQPDCAARLLWAHSVFPAEEFSSDLDPASVKARYGIGPTDPTILYAGDFDDRHGPDLLLQAMPAILKSSPQARLVLVGDGALLWPLRVKSRYMLLDYAVRILGHVGGPDVRQLFAACDLVVVPSRVCTEDWEVLAAWAARRPLIATHAVGDPLCHHEIDSLLVYPNPPSIVWGVERVLRDWELGKRVARRGFTELINSFGWRRVALQLNAASLDE